MTETEWSDDSLELLQQRLSRPLPPRQPARHNRVRARDAERRAERLIPKATELACLVHDGGGPDDIAAFLAGLKPLDLAALPVVLAAMVPVDQPVGDLLAWLDYGNVTTLPQREEAVA